MNPVGAPALDLDTFKILAEALLIGLLVGAERYKSRGPGESGIAGFRTFALASLLGALAGLIDEPALTLASFVALATLVAIGYYRASEESLGGTTEIASLLVFWLGFLLHDHEILAISIAIVLTILLASKGPLHGFVRDELSETELFDTLKFLAVVLVVWPLLPDRSIGPYEFLNPSKIWLLVILVSSIGFAGYLLMRWAGGKYGLYLSALIGGLVSTTATTMSLASRAREDPDISRSCGVAGVVANTAQIPRLLILILVLHRPLAMLLLVPFAGMIAAGLAGAMILGRRVAESDHDLDISTRNPYSITPALKFALFFVAILLLVEGAEAWLGASGVYLASALGGAGSVSAAALSVAQTAATGFPIESAAIAVLLAWTANTLVKMLIAALNGTLAFTLWLGGGLATMLVAGVTCLLATVALR